MDIYNTKHRIQRAKESIEETNLSKRNQALILEYCNERANGFYGKEIGEQRLIKLLSFCKNIAKQIKKDMDAVKEEDIKQYLIKINESEYSEWTKGDYKKILKLWLKWLMEKKGLDIKLDFFKATINKKKIPKMKREEFLSQEEVHKLMENANNLRDKCLIHMAWDLGARIGELGSLKVGDIVFDNEGGASVHLKGKTGERTPYIIESIPTITQWLSVHPARKDAEFKKYPLFVGLGKSAKKKEPICYRTFYKIFELAMGKTKLNKKWNPHLFRHSRALWAAVHNWNNQMANSFFGWSDGSNMFSYYVSLGSSDLKNHMKSMYDQEAVVEKKPEQIKCRCGRLNDPKADFCYKCGLPLNEDVIEKKMNIEKEFEDYRKRIDAKMEKLMKRLST